MTPPHLHVLGIDPGGTTGWSLITVPRSSIYGKTPGQVLEFKYGEIHGPEDDQAIEISRLARQIQNLDYGIGPAVVVEDFDLMPHYNNTSADVVLSPVRIAAKLQMLYHMGESEAFRSGERVRVSLRLMGESLIVMQGRTMAKQTATDERLRAWGLYTHRTGDHIRDATRHAITAIRRAKSNQEFRDSMWRKV